MNDIVGRCAVEKTELKELDDFVSERVYQIAIDPAKSKLAIAKDAFLESDRYFQVAVISTVAAFILASVASAVGFGNLNYGDIATVLFALLVGEVGLAIREERSKGKKLPSWKYAKRNG